MLLLTFLQTQDSSSFLMKLNDLTTTCKCLPQAIHWGKKFWQQPTKFHNLSGWLYVNPNGFEHAYWREGFLIVNFLPLTMAIHHNPSLIGLYLASRTDLSLMNPLTYDGSHSLDWIYQSSHLIRMKESISDFIASGHLVESLFAIAWLKVEGLFPWLSPPTLFFRG